MIGGLQSRAISWRQTAGGCGRARLLPSRNRAAARQEPRPASTARLSRGVSVARGQINFLFRPIGYVVRSSLKIDSSWKISCVRTRFDFHSWSTRRLSFPTLSARSSPTRGAGVARVARGQINFPFLLLAECAKPIAATVAFCSRSRPIGYVVRRSLKIDSNWKSSRVRTRFDFHSWSTRRLSFPTLSARPSPRRGASSRSVLPNVP
jgi:hypothetical protein